MPSNPSRRKFLGTAALAGAGLAMPAWCCRSVAAEGQTPSSTPAAEKLGWTLACQLYTFRAMSFYEALDIIAGLGIKAVEPCFFLRLDPKQPELKTSESLNPAQRKQMKQRMADRGIAMLNYYARLDDKTDGYRAIFDFAKEMGAKNIVAEPPAQVLDTVEKFCDEYQINLAMHNHPKKPGYDYWKPENVLAVLKGRGPRMGACCDTGHWVRSSLDPVACLKTMQGRINALHLKDVAEVGVPKCRDVPLGTGKADYVAVMAEIHRQNFRGVMAIEYEHQSPQLADEVAECVRFVQKQAKALQA